MLKGTKHSAESRAKISAALRGVARDPAAVARSAEAKRGRKLGPHSEETKRKMSAAHTGKKRGPHSQEHKENISKALRSKASGRGFYISGGYRKLTGQWDHPLAIADGTVFEHRKVLYDKIGPGPHMCHWRCGRMLSWDGGPQLGICVDHLDNNRLNNDPENLVPSCRRENIARAWWGN